MLAVLRILGLIISVKFSIFLFMFPLWGDDPPKYDHTDQDSGFKPLQELSFSDRRIRLYLTNGGATTPYGTLVRMESPLCGSFYISEGLYSNDRLMGAKMSLSSDSTHLFVVDTLHKVDTLAVILL